MTPQPMPPDIFRIVYCSRSTEGCSIDSRELGRILDASRRNNARTRVTGALLISGAFFVQALEGSFDAVQTTFERIQTDPRHDDVVLLQADSVTSRIFSDWAMAQVEADDPAHVAAVLSAALLSTPQLRDDTAIASLIDLLSHVLQRNVLQRTPA